MKIVQLPNKQYAIARRHISTLWLKVEYLDIDYLISRGCELWWGHDSIHINDCCCEEISQAEEVLNKLKPSRVELKGKVKFPYLHGKENTFDK